MSGRSRAATRRAGPLFGAVLLVIGVVAAVSPAVTPARALDPTPVPDPTASPAEPTPLADPASPGSSAPAASDVPAASAAPADPAPSLPADPSSSAAPAASADPGPASTPAATSQPSVGLQTTHAWIDTLDDKGAVVATGALDTRLDGLVAGGLYRLWFQVVNGTEVGIDIGPTLLVGRPGATTAPETVPAPDAVTGQPFFVATSAGGPATLTAGGLRLTTSNDAAATAVDGLVGSGSNPAGTLALPAHSFTEVGFTVAVTADVVAGADYSFTMTDGGVALAASVTAEARATDAPSPTPDLTVGGDVVGKPTTLADALAQANDAPVEGPGEIHFVQNPSTSTCAACHRSHTAESQSLGSEPEPISNVCFTCHNGTDLPNLNVRGQYLSAPIPPANDPATGAYYSHPSTSLSNHTTDREDEFSGRTNRHSECADCHSPHNSTTAPGIQTTAGWTASGAIKGASSVSVANGAAGTAPTYTWKLTTTLEYELCFKCHSGFTTLAAVGARDKGKEFNPANGSFHPVERKGTNETSKMAINLSSTHLDSTANPNKLWAFDVGGTVRCTQCHSTQRVREPSGAPAPDANLSPHTSSYEGILIANYKRTPRTAGTNAYSASDFALCYLCHSDRGIMGDNAYTNFPDHSRHVRSLGGSLNAVCSECHAQVHSTAPRPTTQTGSTSRLVVFGPTVTGLNGLIRWTSGGTGSGTCTLRCHGVSHNEYDY